MSSLSNNTGAPRTKINAKNLAIASAAIVIACVEICIINSYAANFPLTDDFSAILSPVLSFDRHHDFSTFLTEVFRPHTQHLQVLLRALAIGLTETIGALDLRWIIFAGSLWTLPVLGIFIRRKEYGLALGFALATSQPLYSESMLWATNAPYLWVNAFALLACFAAAEGATITALIFCLLAFLSWGSGILVLFVLLFYALMRRDYKALAAFAAVSAAAVATLSINKAGLSETATTSWWNCAEYFLSILGSAFAFHRREASLLAGIFLACVTVVTWARLALRLARSAPHERVLSGEQLFLLFLIASLVPVVWYRSGVPESAYTTSRYTLQSCLIALILIRQLTPRFFAIVIPAALFCFFSNSHYFSYYDLRRRVAQAGIERVSLFGNCSALEYPQYSDPLLSEARTKIYRLPEVPFEIAGVENIAAEDAVKPTPAHFPIAIKTALMSDKHTLLSGYVRIGGESKPAFFLKAKPGGESAATERLFRCETVPRIDVDLHMHGDGANLYSGFSCHVDEDLTRAEKYLIVSAARRSYYKPVDTELALSIPRACAP